MHGYIPAGTLLAMENIIPGGKNSVKYIGQ
jgi:hypothetical protein